MPLGAELNWNAAEQNGQQDGQAQYDVDAQSGEIVPIADDKKKKKRKTKVAPEQVAEGAESFEGTGAYLIDMLNFDWPKGTPSDEQSIEQLKKDIFQWGFIEVGNCYYLSDITHGAEMNHVRFKRISNFRLRILYHISSGKNAKRVIEAKNIYGFTRVMDVDTKQLSGFSAFRDFAEYMGNFLWEGSANNWTKVKSKLYAEEKPAAQVETLGWQKGGFSVWGNGLLNHQFHPADRNGIVDFDGKSYYIPSANEEYRHDNTLYVNEKKMQYVVNDIKFEQWARKHYEVFGEEGMIMQCFTFACMFSDHIFYNTTFFPIGFLYGEGGTGKSALVRSLQYLFGLPQDALKLSEKANTVKAKIRALAEFTNVLCFIDEYTNDIDKSDLNTLKGIWDRMGYKRANTDSRYGTENVPINSGVIIAGNEYPNDDPLLQRVIMLEYNGKTFDEAEKTRFNELSDMNARGITGATREVLLAREIIEQQFSPVYRAAQKELKAAFTGIRCTDRMINNCAVLLAVYQLLSPQLNFPYTSQDLIPALRRITEKQNEKRDTGSVTQVFWDCILYSVKKLELKCGYEFQIRDGVVWVRWKECYQAYTVIHNQLYRQKGLAGATMLDKLTHTDAFVEMKKSMRFELGGNTSAFGFDLKRINIDLEGAVAFAEAERNKYKRSEPTDTTSPNAPDPDPGLEEYDKQRSIF